MDKHDKEYEITSGNIFSALGLEQPEELLARAQLLHEGDIVKCCVLII